MTRWIVCSGAAHGPDPDRAGFAPDAEGMDWLELDAPDATTAVEIARLADGDPAFGDAVGRLRHASRVLDAVGSLPYTTRRDAQAAVVRKAEARLRLDSLLAQAGVRVAGARPWTEDETLTRRTRWNTLLRAGLPPEEIERHLGYSADMLAAAVRRHGLA